MNQPRNNPTRFPLTVILPGVIAAAGVLLAAGRLDGVSLFIAGVTAALIAAIGWMHIRRLRSSIEHIQQGLNRFAEGKLEQRLESPPLEELSRLSNALNYMAWQVERRMNVIHQQTTEHEAILASMVEGVIALNRDAIILQANKAAAHVLGTTPELIIGHPMYETFCNHELQKLIEQSLVDGLPAEGEVLMQGAKERSIQIHSTALRNANGENIGALVVLNDITRLRRLERMRRDFVANVSHELKTPLTSIRGFVETLLDGALNEPEEAQRFCKIIAKQVDRLQNIIEDLLSLSRIEQEVEEGQIALTPSPLLETIQSAAQAVGHAAAEKNIRIDAACDASWQANINAPIFEQVILNLLDNAIKYSGLNKTVRVEVLPQGDDWNINVIDEGIGIEAQHLDRIFERFYRVDKARSRKGGGTGLGLAIVKRIVIAHGGHIHVTSTPGEGSTFSIRLPRHQAQTNDVPFNSQAGASGLPQTVG
jgi:two-component system phosphate regulon sensor histidine kinase PhoR